MYKLPYHTESDPAVIRAFMQRHPFAVVTGISKNNAPVATQVPLAIDNRDGQLLLRGHIMRNTDHYKAFASNPQVLAVFTGPHTYVSGSWYSDPHQPSTWNYMSVHAQGTLRWLDTPGLIDTLRETSLHFEGGNVASATAYDNLPNALAKRLVKAIAGFEIVVTQLDAVFKLSQNRDEASYLNIIDELTAQGDADAVAIAEAMRARAGTVFQK